MKIHCMYVRTYVLLLKLPKYINSQCMNRVCMVQDWVYMVQDWVYMVQDRVNICSRGMDICIAYWSSVEALILCVVVLVL